MARRDFLKYLGFVTAQPLTTNEIKPVMTEEQKVQELLKPRYKVIADWPGNRFYLGQVLHLQKNRFAEWEIWYVVFDGFESMSESDLKEYPHLFRKLEWWEERTLADMPKYIKWHPERTSRSHISKVKEWKQFDDGFGFKYVRQEKGGYVAAKYAIPATSTEYLTYQSKRV